MTDRNLTTLGTIASGLGLVTSIITVIFTQYKVASLVSLFVVEIIVILIWTYYARQKNRTLFPYNYEVEFEQIRYVFETENSMTYETVKVVKVTQPHLSGIPVRLTWSGRGQIALETPLLSRKPDFSFDGLTGKLEFSYPVSPSLRFGDTLVVYYKFSLEDTTNQNKPELYVSTKKPIKLIIWDVVLKYKQSCPPAYFGIIQIEGAPSTFLQFQKEGEIHFDERTKSYRVVISNPMQGRKYQLKWEK